jgi:hypothetical protein
MAYLNPAQLVAQRNAHIIYTQIIICIYIYAYAHIIYILHTYIYSFPPDKLLQSEWR